MNTSARDELVIYTVYKKTTADFKTVFSVRPFYAKARRSNVVACVSMSLEEIRAPLEAMGLQMVPRQFGDAPEILECWL